MSDPPHLSDGQLFILSSSSISSISDNFFVRCNFLPIQGLNGLFRSILAWISFYFMGDAIVTLLLLLPVIFLFQSPGKQKKLLALYNKIRLLMLKFLTYCNFSISMSAILGWALGVSSPCLQGKRSHIVSFGYIYQSPSVNIVLAAAMSYFVISSGTKKATTNRSCLGLLLDKYFMKTLAVLISFFFLFTDIIYGKCSVIQALFSLSLGFFLCIFVDFLPMLFMFIIETLFIVLLCLCMVFNQLPALTSDMDDNYWELCFDGIIFIAFTNILLFRFVKTRQNMKFSSKFDDFLHEETADSETVEAVFGELDDENKIEEDLSVILKRDLMDTAIALIVKIAIHFISVFVLRYLSYK